MDIDYSIWPMNIIYLGSTSVWKMKTMCCPSSIYSLTIVKVKVKVRVLSLDPKLALTTSPLYEDIKQLLLTFLSVGQLELATKTCSKQTHKFVLTYTICVSLHNYSVRYSQRHKFTVCTIFTKSQNLYRIHKTTQYA